MSTKPSPSRRQYSPAEKARWLQEQDEEGLSYQQVSIRSGVPVPTIAGWRRQLRLRGSGGEGFVEVRATRAVTMPVAGDGLLPGAVRIVLANGRRLEIERGFDDAQLVARLVAVLEA